MIKIAGVGVCVCVASSNTDGPGNHTWGTNYGIQNPFFVWEDVAVEFT